MPRGRRWLRRCGATLFALALLLAGIFGGLQTPPGQAWLGEFLAGQVSQPGTSVTIVGLTGLIPFDMRAERIEVADARGVWLAIQRPHAALGVSELLHGEVHLHALSAAAVEVERLPDGGPPDAKPSPSLAERLRLPALPVDIAVDRLDIDNLRLAAPVLGEPVAATVNGTAGLEEGGGRATFDLRRTDGQPGGVTLAASLAGTPPLLDLRLTADEPSGILLGRLLPHGDRAPFAFSLAGKGPLADWRGRLTASGGSAFRVALDLTLTARPEPVVMLAGTASLSGLLPPSVAPFVGDEVPVHVRATLRKDGSVSLDEMSLRLANGVDLRGHGTLGSGPRVRNGRLRLIVADLRPFDTVFGLPLVGTLTLDATQQAPGGNASIALTGSLANLQLGIPAIDALTGGAIALSGSLAQDAGNRWTIDALTIAGAKASLRGKAAFDPATGRISATVDAAIPSLQPLGGRGRIAARASVEWSAGRLQATANLDGDALQGGGRMLDEIRLEAQLPDVWAGKGAISGRFRSGDLAGTLGLDADAGNPAELVLRRLVVQAGGGRVEGDVRIDRKTLLARGTLSAHLPDLSRWAALAGEPIAGALSLTAKLEGGSGQEIDLTASGERLSAAASDARIGHAAVSAHLADLWTAPSGKAQVKLTDLAIGASRITTASLSLDSRRPGRVGFAADARGNLAEPFSLTGQGELESAPGGRTMRLEIARFDGTLGHERFRLARPLRLTRDDDDLSLTDLALTVGAGRIDGGLALRNRAVSGRFTAQNLPVAAAARLAGIEGAGGTLSLDASFGGPVAAPNGRFTLVGRGLVAAGGGRQLPPLTLDMTGDYHDRALALSGRVAARKGGSLAFTGSLPLVLSVAPPAVAMPPTQRLNLRLEGKGDLAGIADLLPIGEDRLSGRYTLDAQLGGTPAAPTAGGHLTIADGRYESFATGAVLTKLRVELVGDRDRFTLQALTASDTAGGHLTARGGIALGGSAGPSIELSATLAGFRLAARDEAVITASGTLAVAGPLTGPKVTGRLTIDRADCTIPDSLPPSITRLKVVEIHRAGPHGRRRAAANPQEADLAAPLDIAVDLPGRTFVRGHGLDSEWRGHLKIAGTSAAPQIVGSIDSVRGTFAVLGKTFRLSRGTIAFDGGTGFDPRLDIATEVAAGDITAQALISGTAAAPKVALSSTPVVPQDEILARVLFGRGLGQINAGEGLQVAEAAAALTGGGIGVLDRVRGGLGLDRLGFGSGGAGALTRGLSPVPNTSVTSGPMVSGGKYVAKGVYVGATQGTTPDSSKVTVEVDLYPHLTVETEHTRAGETGMGLNYKYDY